VNIRPGTVRAIAACAAGERLISGWQSIGFYTAAAPSTALIRSVSSAQTVRGDRLDARARAGVALRGVHAVLQAGAVCGGGS
jgi:hypothetical protein